MITNFISSYLLPIFARNIAAGMLLLASRLPLLFGLDLLLMVNTLLLTKIPHTPNDDNPSIIPKRILDTPIVYPFPFWSQYPYHLGITRVPSINGMSMAWRWAFLLGEVITCENLTSFGETYGWSLRPCLWRCRMVTALLGRKSPRLRARLNLRYAVAWKGQTHA